MAMKGKKARRAAAPAKDAAAVAGNEEATGTVVIGTYEGAILGVQASSGEQVFGYAPHTGCVKALTCNGAGKMATGASDHTARVFDLARGVEMGEIPEHDDTVTCVEFWGDANFVTAGADGQVCVWRAGDWELLKKFKAHKHAVASLSIHPAGRLMASSGRDNAVRLWDLTRGTSAANVPTDDAYDLLRWSPKGERLLALNTRELTAIDVAGAKAPVTYKDPGATGLMRVSMSAAAFLDEERVLLGDGKGVLKVLKLGSDDFSECCTLPQDAGRVRIKSIARGPKGLLAVGCSGGRVEVWRHAPGAETAVGFSLLRVIDTDVRLTCMAFWTGTCGALAPPGTGPLGSQEDSDDEAIQEEPESAEDDESVEAPKPKKKKGKRKRAAA